ncbi:hypothetical protein [Edaphobacter aggregans]|uniref:hypothetical protein n=1 Tax=Edaphobacter aggregans TaxID=570835 RepID=UPI0012F99EF1|nr:hypothetical protein [Edaphobacter aggregans]
MNARACPVTEKVFLIVRLVIEAVFGAVCFVDLLLLPQIWRERDQLALATGKLLGVTLVILIGILCFKDVVKISHVLKGTRPSSSVK